MDSSFLQIERYFEINKQVGKLLFFLCLLLQFLLMTPQISLAQNSDSMLQTSDIVKGKIKVFLDCDDCDDEYLQEEIKFVDFVRDPQLADVHILITYQNTAGTGRLYDIQFIGKNRFDGEEVILHYKSYAADTDDIIREGVARKIMLGLIPYVSKTEIADKLRIKYKSTDEGIFTQYESDPWDNWIFNIDLTGGLEAEENQKEYTVKSGLKAKRVTEEWKLKADCSYTFEEEIFDDDDGRVLSNKREWEINADVVKSISDHWSIGIFGELHSSTYRNLKVRRDIDLGIEYNFFPWNESNKWLLTLAYHNGIKNYNYFDETIYSKLHETLWFQSVDLGLEIIREWGSTDCGLNFSHLIQLDNKYNLNADIGMSLRVTQGLALRFSLNAESIHNQIYLPKGDASWEEILLKQRQLVTSYDINFEIGVSYTFGSIYNSIINRRF